MRRCIAVFMLVAGLFGSTPAYSSTIDFTGAYDVSNWTAVLQCGLNPLSPGPCGQAINTAGAPYSITLTSGNEARNYDLGANESQDFLFTAFETATISFTWSYVSYDRDGPFYDPFGWLLNGAFTNLSGTLKGDCRLGFGRSPQCDQSGIALFLVAPGDVFGLRANSLDVWDGSAITTVSNFSATTPVPEPSSFMLLGSVCLLATWRRFRRLAI